MAKNILRTLLIAAAAASLGLTACAGRSAGTLPVVNPSPNPSASASSSPSTSPSASPTASPTAAPTGAPGTFSTTIINNDSAITSANITLYIYGQDNTTSNYEGVNSDGSTYALTSGMSVKPIAWLDGGSNSETIYLPALKGARVYIVDGASLSSIFTVNGSAGPSAPAPWSNDGSQSIYFDNVEYAETSAGNVNYDLSQTDTLGLDLEVATTGAAAPGPIGFESGAITAFKNALISLGSPWNTLSNQYPYHIINPQHGTPNFFPSATFLDTAIMNSWNTYGGGNWMEITAASLSATGYSGALYGTVNASGNFDFYNTQSTSGILIGTIESPQTYAGTNGESVTEQMLAQNGAFNDFTMTYIANPALGPAIGNRLSGALNSGVMQPATPPGPGAPLTIQPICTGRFPSVATAPYQNQYAGSLHTIANTYAYLPGSAYGYPYDDLCGTSTDSTVTGITQMTITINPS